ncbi:MAG: MEDS domain-containing protein [Actinobacteria bacterium]|nr:MEDS domain-containing protein [Actinomycetota bacterium]
MDTDIGIPGASLMPGDHICGFFFGVAERDEVLLPYLRKGIEAGHKCLCIVDASEPSTVIAALGDGVDVDGAVSSRQLEVLPAGDAYLRTGTFATEDMLNFLRDNVGRATTGGYHFARIAGETTWLFDDPPGADQFIDYEAEINRYAPEYPQSILCLYDLARFGGGMMVDLLKTHPKILLGGLLIDNPHYLTPDEFRATRR